MLIASEVFNNHNTSKDKECLRVGLIPVIHQIYEEYRYAAVEMELLSHVNNENGSILAISYSKF